MNGTFGRVQFKLDIKKIEDPEGGSRAVITLDGKYLPTKLFQALPRQLNAR